MMDGRMGGWSCIGASIECNSVQVTNPWILIGFELSAAPSEEVLDGAKVFLPNALILVELSSSTC